MRLNPAMLLLALASCDASPDGYVFDEQRAEYELDTVVIEVVRHDTPEAVRRAAAQVGASPEGKEVMTFGLLYPEEGRCVIHVLDPAKRYQPQWLGHEVMHCLYGRWHG